MNYKRLLRPRRLAGRLLVVGVLFFAFLTVVYLFAVWSLSWQLAALKEADRRAGLPTTIEEAWGPVVPEAENAEGPLLAAAAIAESLHRKTLEQLFGTANVDERTIRYHEPPYATLLGKLAEADPEFSKLMEQAESRPRLAFAQGAESDVEPYSIFVGPQIRVLRTESARAIREISEGRRAAALQRMARLYRLARLGYDASPFFEYWKLQVNVIISEVHSVIDRVLDSGEISNQSRDKLEAALQLAEDNPRSAAKAHHGQKLYLLEHYQTYGDAPLAMRAWSKLAAVHLRNRVEIAAVMSELAPSESYSGKTALEARKPYLNRYSKLLKSAWQKALLLPAYTAIANETSNLVIPYREIAVARCLRVLNALQRRGVANADIHQLGLPDSATTDPFTDEPLRIIRTTSGWVVYSRAEDGEYTPTRKARRGRYVVGKVDELQPTGK